LPVVVAEGLEVTGLAVVAVLAGLFNSQFRCRLVRIRLSLVLAVPEGQPQGH